MIEGDFTEKKVKILPNIEQTFCNRMFSELDQSVQCSKTSQLNFTGTLMDTEGYFSFFLENT